MNDEMDLMQMDEHQRLCWMKANRVMIFIVGIVWIGMIVSELASGRVPAFLIIMLPILALTRLVVYKLYVRRS